MLKVPRGTLIEPKNNSIARLAKPEQLVSIAIGISINKVHTKVIKIILLHVEQYQSNKHRDISLVKTS